MQQKIDIKVEGTCLTLDFQASGLDTTVMTEMAKELLPLLETRVAAYLAKEELNIEDWIRRSQGILAQEMVCQASLNATLKQYEVLVAVSSGNADIADYGFPEFRAKDEPNV